MQLRPVEKIRYRKHLNQVIIVFILSFLIIGVGLGQLLITLFSHSGADNFWFNFSGVVLGLVIVIGFLNYCKEHQHMTEILYVWQLKQQINYIYRKLKSVKKAAFDGANVDALIILEFYYQACHQLYTLDDNTITLPSLLQEQKKLQEFLLGHNLSVDSNQYQQSLLIQF